MAAPEEPSGETGDCDDGGKGAPKKVSAANDATARPMKKG